MVNIIDDELWNPEPALRPEDEIILRKLHEMLQSTADDLKLLSGELSKFHEPGVQIKTAPTPLDEEFNEKVHIEEVVNAKFHGYKMIETQNVPEVKPRNDRVEGIQSVNNNQRPKVMNTRAQVNTTVTKRTAINRNLGISRTKIIQINDNNKDSSKNEKLNNGEVYKAPTVAYDEFCYKHIEPEVKETPRKLQVQNMPRINIRSELKEQRVLQLDIVPDNNVKKTDTAQSNVSVVAIRHEIVAQEEPVKLPESLKNPVTIINPNTVRKISKMSTCDSSGSANNISSDAQVKLNTQKRIISTIRNSPKSSARSRNKNNTAKKNDQGKHIGLNLDEWKKKLNIVYASSGSKKPKQPSPKGTTKKYSPKKTNAPKTLNNAAYIPYSKLTVGGVRASEIEREISDLPNKNNIPLSPILDKILSSRENSFNKESPRRHRFKDSPKILTTSDENLLQEVIYIEKSVSETLSKNLKVNIEPVMKSPTISSDSSNGKENASYADDFEDEKSEYSGKPENPKSTGGKTKDHSDSVKSNLSYVVGDLSTDEDNDEDIPGPSKPSKNTTYTKSNLTFKDSVDIFEFIHSVDMQDNATQSSTTNKISPKETQTSPRKDRQGLQPTIHNDLWPSIDPRREVEKMFEMEKDFIKKLIIDEYGDLLEKNIKKPSTSNENQEEDTEKNVSVVQKNTQTSPAHVKSVMTSPKRTKTRTTSPLYLSVPVHQQTSPAILVTDEERRLDVANEADDISVNLSSPRFSLRLPQNSREVFCNLEAHTAHTPTPSKISTKQKLDNRNIRKTAVSSSSSVDADNSSSELSSLGEVRLKRLRKRVPSISECSSSSKYSSDFPSVGILPLRSEGEVSLGQIRKNRMGKIRHSEGETSFDPI